MAAVSWGHTHTDGTQVIVSKSDNTANTRLPMTSAHGKLKVLKWVRSCFYVALATTVLSGSTPMLKKHDKNKAFMSGVLKCISFGHLEGLYLTMQKIDSNLTSLVDLQDWIKARETQKHWYQEWSCCKSKTGMKGLVDKDFLYLYVLYSLNKPRVSYTRGLLR